MKRLTTKQLKNRMDNLILALAFGSIANKVGSEEWSSLAKQHDSAIAEFYARRNHKQYLDPPERDQDQYSYLKEI